MRDSFKCNTKYTDGVWRQYFVMLVPSAETLL